MAAQVKVRVCTLYRLNGGPICNDSAAEGGIA